uniref:Ribonuclease H-like domain-containing protein n=1 Tax=Tanacetum cinerariifolium TaxID=118510 RepID=A0A6L2JNV1_TANCI|nr:ribonuclease H-like domain-containing protein [Tanacetum cinerariifolium]
MSYLQDAQPQSTRKTLAFSKGDGPFQPKTADGDAKPESQWTPYERRVFIQDQCLKSIIMSCLPNDIMESVLRCVLAKETWRDLVHNFKGPLDTKENKIMDLKLKYQTFRAKSTKSLSQTYTRYKNLFNELTNDDVNLSKHEINEEVSDDEEVTQVKQLMALADDELTVGKSHARNGKWDDITIRKVNTLLSMDEDVDWILYYMICKREDRHNRVIHIRGGMLAESSQSSESLTGVKCNTCGSTIHSISDHNDLDYIKRGKFDAKADDGYFLGYSFVLKAFRFFNTRRQKFEETYHISPDEFVYEDNPSRQYQIDSDISYDVIPHGCSLSELTQDNQVPEVTALNEPGIPHTEDTEGPLNLINIEGTHEQNVQNDQMITQPTDVPLGNDTEFYRNKVWTLVPLPYEKIAIGSKWVFRNKKYELGITTKNKARLVAQGYSQEEGIDYDETFAPVVRMEAIMIFFAFATYMNFKVYQMNVKSAFLNAKLKKEVYVKQPPSFESSEFPDYVCKLDKALYGLKQAPKTNSVLAFCPGLRFVKILRFATKDPVFCQDRAFCYKRSCVLSRSCVLLQKIMRFVKILRFATKDPAVYQDPAPNGEALRKCILSGPYKPTTVLVHVVEATDDSQAVPEHTTVEAPMNMSLENKALFLAEKEAIHLILTGIGDDIYSTVDACQTTQEIESMESYYTRFYKLMNEMIRNNLTVITMQVNVQLLQQLQPEWSRFVTIVKQQHNLDEVSYHKLFDIMKQYQNEVNELRAEKLARNANPLAFVATAQASQDQYYQTSRQGDSQPITPPSNTASEEDSDPEQAQRDKDMQKNLAFIAKYFKKIYKPTNNNLKTSSKSKNKNVDMTPRYKNDDHSGQFGTQRMVNVVAARENVGSKVVQQSGIECFNCKEYGHFAKECKKLKRVKDSTYHKEKMMLCKQAEQGVPLQAEQRFLLQIQAPILSQWNRSSQAKTKVITDLKLREEHDIEKMLSMEKQLKFLNEIVYKRSQSIQTIHMMAPKVPTYNGRPTFANPRYLKQAQSKIPCLYAFPYDKNTHANRLIPDGEETLALERESRSKLNKDSVRPYDYTKLNSLYEIFKPLTQDKIRQAYNVMTNNINHFKQIVDDAWITHSKDLFHAPTAHDMKILIQTCLMPLAIKTQSDSLKFVHELKQEMHADLKYVKSLEEIDKLESDKAEFSDMYDMILQECVSKDVMCSYLKSLSDLDALAKLQFLGKPAPFSNSLDRVYFQKTKSVSKTNVSEGLSKPVTAQTLPQAAKKAVSNTNVLKQGMYRIDNRTSHTRAPQLPQTIRNTNPCVSTSIGVNHKPIVSRPQLKSNQSRNKVLPNNSQVKAKKTQVEVHPRIPSVSNKMKSVTACKDSLNSRTLNANVVCATCNKCLVDSNHFACVTKMLNDVHARTKKPSVVPISTRKPKSQANKSIATPNKKKVALKSTKQKPQSYFRVRYENTNKAWKWWIERQSPSGYKWIVQLILFIVDSGCTKHMTGNLKLLCNFVENFLGFTTSKASITISSQLVNFVMRIWRLLSGSQHVLLEIFRATPTQAWLWHRRLSHLNFDYINLVLKKEVVIGLPKLKDGENLDKIKEKGDQCILVGYSTQSKGYRVYNKRIRMIVESIHIRFDEIKEVQDVYSSADADVPSQQELDLLFGPLYDEFFNAGSNPLMNVQSTSAPSTHTNVHAEENNNDQAEEGEQLQDDEFTNPFCVPTQEEAESSPHNIEQVRRNPSTPVQTRRQLATDPEMCMYALNVSTAEPKNIKEAMVDSALIEAMQEELHQFDRLHMDVKTTFLNGPLKEEVYVAQLDGFVDPDHPEKVYQLRKALYGLKRAPMAWYDELLEFLTSKGFTKGGMFINQAKYTLEILHKYGMDKGQSIGTPMAIKPKLDADLSGNPVDQTDYRSKIRSLMNLTSSRPDIVQAVCFCARYRSRPTEKHLKEVKKIFRYLRGTVNMGLWYPKGSSFEITAFSDADHAGCIDSRKITSGRIQFLGDKLVSWMSKKQNCTKMSSAEAEYLALSTSCAEVMWMRTQLQEYGFNYNKILLYCDSQSAIAISCNPV